MAFGADAVPDHLDVIENHGRIYSNAGIPVMALPRIRVWISFVSPATEWSPGTARFSSSWAHGGHRYDQFATLSVGLRSP